MRLTFKKLKHGLKVRRSYTHVDEATFLLDADGHLIEPKCPDCGFGAMRQKCAFERGGYCGRHDVAELFKEALKHDPLTHLFKARLSYDGLQGHTDAKGRWVPPTPALLDECRVCNRTEEEHGN